VRPVTYYLSVALALGLFVVLARTPGLRWKAPAVLLISVLPWLAAWQIRNRVETGYGGFSSVSDEIFYFLEAANVTGRLEHRSNVDFGEVDFTNNPGQSYLYEPYLALHPEQAGWSQTQRIAFMHSEAVRIIRAHFGVYLRSCLTDLLKPVFYPSVYYFDPSLHPKHPVHAAGVEAGGQARWRVALSKAKGDPILAAETAIFLIALLAVYLFAVRGVFSGSLHNACMWLLLGTSLYLLAVSAAAGARAAASPRFRLPVMPFVCILAAAGVWRTKTVAE
jgi:hypothetical protein